MRKIKCEDFIIGRRYYTAYGNGFTVIRIINNYESNITVTYSINSNIEYTSYLNKDAIFFTNYFKFGRR